MDDWLWRIKEYPLWRGVCDIPDLLQHRRLFLDAGAVSLLADKILNIAKLGGLFYLSGRDAEVVLRCSTVLASLVTESQEGDPRHYGAYLTRW